MHHEALNPTPEDPPITIIREIRVKPGSEAAFEESMSALIREAVKQPGHLGTTVVKPTVANGPYQLIYKFSRRSMLEEWHGSELRRSLMEPVLPHTISDTFDTFEGLETWFDVAKPGGPPRWKTTIVSWTAIFPTAAMVSGTMVAFNFNPFWGIKSLILTLFVVPITAYVTGPIAFKAWHRWLYPNRDR